MRENEGLNIFVGCEAGMSHFFLANTGGVPALRERAMIYLFSVRAVLDEP